MLPVVKISDDFTEGNKKENLNQSPRLCFEQLSFNSRPAMVAVFNDLVERKQNKNGVQCVTSARHITRKVKTANEATLGTVPTNTEVFLRSFLLCGKSRS